MDLNVKNFQTSNTATSNPQTFFQLAQKFARMFVEVKRGASRTASKGDF